MAQADFNYSDWNSELTWNETEYSIPPPPADMRLTLCNTTPACYEYFWTQGDGWGGDPRNMAYGKAKCNAYYFSIYVHYCWVANEWA